MRARDWSVALNCATPLRAITLKLLLDLMYRRTASNTLSRLRRNHLHDTLSICSSRWYIWVTVVIALHHRMYIRSRWSSPPNLLRGPPSVRLRVSPPTYCARVSVCVWIELIKRTFKNTFISGSKKAFLLRGVCYKWCKSKWKQGIKELYSCPGASTWLY